MCAINGFGYPLVLFTVAEKKKLGEQTHIVGTYRWPCAGGTVEK